MSNYSRPKWNRSLTAKSYRIEVLGICLNNMYGNEINVFGYTYIHDLRKLLLFHFYAGGFSFKRFKNKKVEIVRKRFRISNTQSRKIKLLNR